MLLNPCVNLLPTVRKCRDCTKWSKWLVLLFYHSVLWSFSPHLVINLFVEELYRQIWWSLTFGTVEMKSLLWECLYFPPEWRLQLFVIQRQTGSGETTVISLPALGPYSFPGPAPSAPNRTFITNSTPIPQPHTAWRQAQISISCMYCMQTQEDKHRWTDNAHVYVWIMNNDKTSGLQSECGFSIDTNRTNIQHFKWDMQTKPRREPRDPYSTETRAWARPGHTHTLHLCMLVMVIHFCVSTGSLGGSLTVVWRFHRSHTAARRGSDRQFGQIPDGPSHQRAGGPSKNL